MHLANIKDIIFDKTGIPKNEQRIFLLDGEPKEIPLEELSVIVKASVEVPPDYRPSKEDILALDFPL